MSPEQKNNTQSNNAIDFKEYYKGGFLDDKGNIKKELIDNYAQEIANYIKSKEKGKEKEITSAQLRRFYHDLKSIERKIQNKIREEKKANEVFEEFLPEIKMVKAKASYAYRGGGKDSKIPQKFKDFLTAGIEKINNYQDFIAFMKHFEAVVGYLYGLGLKD